MLGVPALNKEVWQLVANFSLSFQVHYNVGKNLADKGNQTAAIRYYREAVRYCKRPVSQKKCRLYSTRVLF